MRKRNIFVKFSALTLSVMLVISGCQNSRYDRNGKENTTGTTQETTVPEETTGSSENNKPKEDFTEEDLAIQEEFDKYLTDLYVESMTSSLVSAHFDLENPEAYGITEYDYIWGGDFLESSQNAVSDDEELLNELKAFQYDSLTVEQQLTYDTLIAYMENSLPLDEHYYFGESFSPTSGTQFELNLILSEFTINSKEDLEDYIQVLSSCDEYVAELLEFEKWRADQGYAMTDSAIDDVIGQCNDILAASEPAFLPVIREVIDGCDFLTDEEKTSYKSQITTLATENFIPAYQNIVNVLGTLKGKRSVEGGLCNYENGTEYYEALIRLYTGSDKSLDELIETIEQNINDGLTEYYTLLMANPDLQNTMYSDLTYAETEPDEILSYLMDMLESDFPAPVYEEYTLKYVAESMESSSNPAFYLIPPTDNYKHNVIYVNNSEEYASMDLFPLLAHEGMPGHMYQINYFLSLNPHPVRSLLGFNGYAEGWAQYVEHYSYKWSGLDENLGDMLVVDDQFGFALYSRIDIGINYEGWGVSDIENFLSQYLTSTDMAAELYDLFINDPGIYLQYYVGEMEILELREYAEDQMGSDFDIKEFHEFFLTTGPTYYEIIKDRMLLWMEE